MNDVCAELYTRFHCKDKTVDILEKDLYGNIIMDKLEKDVKFKESFENNIKILIDKERH